MINKEIEERYPCVYDGEFAVVHDMSEDYAGLAYGFWKGFFSLDNKKFIEDMMVTSQKTVKDHDIKIFLSDHSMLKVVPKEVVTWLHDNWYRNAAENGLLFEIALNAQSTIANMSLRKMLDNSKTSGVQTLEAPTIDDALSLCKSYLEKTY